MHRGAWRGSGGRPGRRSPPPRCAPPRARARPAPVGSRSGCRRSRPTRAARRRRPAGRTCPGRRRSSGDRRSRRGADVGSWSRRRAGGRDEPPEGGTRSPPCRPLRDRQARRGDRVPLANLRTNLSDGSWQPERYVPGRLLLPAELGQQRVLLLGAEAADAARRRNVVLLHDLARADLPHARQALEHTRNLHLADGVVIFLVEDRGEREVPALELGLQLCPLATRLSGLLQGLLALLGRQGWQCHVASSLRRAQSGRRSRPADWIEERAEFYAHLGCPHNPLAQVRTLRSRYSPICTGEWYFVLTSPDPQGLDYQVIRPPYPLGRPDIPPESKQPRRPSPGPGRAAAAWLPPAAGRRSWPGPRRSRPSHPAARPPPARTRRWSPRSRRSARARPRRPRRSAAAPWPRRTARCRSCAHRAPARPRARSPPRPWPGRPRHARAPPARGRAPRPRPATGGPRPTGGRGRRAAPR